MDALPIEMLWAIIVHCDQTSRYRLSQCNSTLYTIISSRSWTNELHIHRTEDLEQLIEQRHIAARDVERLVFEKNCRGLTAPRICSLINAMPSVTHLDVSAVKASRFLFGFSMMAHRLLELKDERSADDVIERAINQLQHIRIGLCNYSIGFYTIIQRVRLESNADELTIEVVKPDRSTIEMTPETQHAILIKEVNRMEIKSRC